MNGRSLESDGVVTVHASKTALPIAYTILALFGVPTYVVFDGDGDCRADQTEMHRKLNRDIQTLLGVENLEDFPVTAARERWAAFQKTLEQALKDAIPEFDAKCQQLSEKNDWRVKSGETYAAVISAEGAAPPVLTEIIAAARNLIR